MIRIHAKHVAMALLLAGLALSTMAFVLERDDTCGLEQGCDPPPAERPVQ